MSRHNQFKRLYKKFIDGSRWLNSKMQDGSFEQKDMDDFERLVAEPMNELWQEFSSEEQEQWETVMSAVELFDGTIVLEEDTQRRAYLEDRKKRNRKKWKRYFQQY